MSMKLSSSGSCALPTVLTLAHSDAQQQKTATTPFLRCRIVLLPNSSVACVCCPAMHPCDMDKSDLDVSPGDVARVGGQEGREGEAGQRVLCELAQQIARLLQALEFQRIQAVEHLRTAAAKWGKFSYAR